jgi:hypothetical protein
MTAARLEQVFAAIDAANVKDSASVVVDGAALPANLVYGRRMSAELDRFAPVSSEALQIAARGQHIERWIIPRAAYPMDKPGYYRWRRELKEHHAKRLAEIMAPLGYDAATIERVATLVRKQRPKEDAEIQTLEDVVCIVFLKYELDGFLAKYKADDAKLADILAKTWQNMSEKGHAAALALPPPPAVVKLLHQGLAALAEK